MRKTYPSHKQVEDRDTLTGAIQIWVVSGFLLSSILSFLSCSWLSRSNVVNLLHVEAVILLNLKNHRGPPRKTRWCEEKRKHWNQWPMGTLQKIQLEKSLPSFSEDESQNPFLRGKQCFHWGKQCLFVCFPTLLKSIVLENCELFTKVYFLCNWNPSTCI